jgi:hypothetical protein
MSSTKTVSLNPRAVASFWRCCESGTAVPSSHYAQRIAVVALIVGKHAEHFDHDHGVPSPFMPTGRPVCGYKLVDSPQASNQANI